MSSGLAAFLFFILLADPCKKDDVGIAYGVCDTAANQRDLIFYWKRDCEVTNVTLPDPTVRRIGCDFGCSDEKFFDTSVPTCSTNLSSCCVKCGNGTEVESGEIWIRDWSKLPSGFTGDWRLDGFGMTTGILQKGQEARLDVEIDMEKSSGNAYFDYVGFYTGYGSALYMLFDNKPFENNSLPLTGREDYARFPPIPYGRHILSLVYRAALYSESAPVEGARLTYMYVYGSTRLSSVCVKCGKGFYSSGGYECTSCPVNKYGDEEGLTQCKNCSADSYSFVDATSCMTRPDCTRNDYDETFGMCNFDTGKMPVTYNLTYPSFCKETSTSKPEDRNDTCFKCNPGLYRNGTECIACPTGQYREDPSSDDSKCLDCPPGTVTFKSLYFKNLNISYFGEQFSSECNSFGVTWADCSTGGTGGNGWASNGKVFTSGNYYIGPMSSYLYSRVNGSYGATVEFSYRVHLQPTSFFAYWAGNSSVTTPTIINSSKNSDEWTSVEVAYNSNLFTWSFNKRGAGFDSHGRIADWVEIDHIAFYGVKDAKGGATSCRKCANGSYSDAGSTSCTQCTPGTYALAGDPKCSPCPGDTYTETLGTAECLPCGNQNVAVREHTGCEIRADGCGVTVNETHVFDLSRIQKLLSADGNNNTEMIGPIEIPGWEPGTFYLGVCQSIGSRKYCKSNDNTSDVSIESLFCEVNSDGSVSSVGNKTNITFFENEQTGEHGINITYYDGEFFGDFNYDSYRGNRSAEVLFVCKPGAGVGTPQKPRSRNNSRVDFITTPHQYHFVWETEYACRLCNADDFSPIESDCVNSQAITTFVLNPSAKCAGGFLQPESTSKSCTMPVVTLNGGMLALIIIIVVVVVAVVVVVLVLLIRKNRKLKYQLVQKQNLSIGGVGEGAGAAAMVTIPSKN